MKKITITKIPETGDYRVVKRLIIFPVTFVRKASGKEISEVRWLTIAPILQRYEWVLAVKSSNNTMEWVDHHFANIKNKEIKNINLMFQSKDFKDKQTAFDICQRIE